MAKADRQTDKKAKMLLLLLRFLVFWFWFVVVVAVANVLTWCHNRTLNFELSIFFSICFCIFMSSKSQNNDHSMQFQHGAGSVYAGMTSRAGYYAGCSDILMTRHRN